MFQIDKCADVYVDACVRNEASQLMFLSVFGRDTATKELMARIQIAKGTEGLSTLDLIGHGEHQGQRHTVFVGDARNLEKVTGRMPKGLYGELTHLWIFQPEVRAPDKGALQAWLIERREPSVSTSQYMRERVWLAVCEMANVPLLAHWREPVLQEIWDDMVFEMGVNTQDKDRIARFSAPLGPVVAYRVALSANFPDRVSKLIRSGKLKLDVSDQADLDLVGRMQGTCPQLPLCELA